ncbi:MAG TPA: flagellar filament capping protein FliD [Acidobacteriaceae bacterium]|jgi:flagellar hook-associated protein 2|nr:flagellar filament capping protein FliD [Acidobacteriaceae bacterium]
MGSVGLSFGSPTSGQGFDVSTTVSQIVTNLQAVETPWKSQLTTLQSQDTALTSIGTDLSSLSTALSSLTESQGIFAEKEGSSSDTSVVALTNATSAAVAGSHTILVGQLAQTYSYANTSGTIGTDDTLTGTLTIGGQQITISDGTVVDPGSGDTIPQNNTLATLASYINEGDYGVQANVVTDSAGDSQLALVSDTTGAGGSVTIDGSQLTDSTTSVTGFTFAQAQQGQDAEFSVDGLSTTSSSNTVTDAIPGVTMQLLDASPNESVQIEITNDNTDVESAVSTFVSAYNTVVGDLNTQEGSTSSGTAEPLYGSSTMALLQEQLQQAITFTQSSGAITSLSQLGITPSTNNDGTLTLDTSSLDSVLNSNYQDVTDFFQADGGYTSFGGNLTATLNNLGNSGPNGAIYLALQQDSTQESDLNTNITNEDNKISAEQTQLTTELNEANYTLQEIPSQIDEVNELYSAITGYNQNSNG